MPRAWWSASSAWSHCCSVPSLSGGRVATRYEGGEPEGAVPLPHQVEQIGDLGLHLLRSHVEVRVVLGELADPRQPGQRARPLVAVAAAHLRIPQRQVAVGAERALVDVGRLRAVHRLQAEHVALDVELEHVVLVELPVPRLLPQLLVHQQRGRDLLVAALIERLARVLLQLAHQHHAAGQPERRAGGDVVEVEQVELPPELAVVALLRLLEPPEMLVELLLGEPGGPVDPLQHRVLLVPAPVGAGGGEELEGLDLAGRGHVRAAAEIEEVALPVDRDGGRGEAAQDLHLERLAPLLEERDGALPRHLLARERVVGLHDLAHGVLDAREILGRERLRLQEVVVEAVLDRGADGDLHLGEEPLHRLRHHVRRRVTERGQGLGVAVELPRQVQVPGLFKLRHVLPVSENNKASQGCAR